MSHTGNIGAGRAMNVGGLGTAGRGGTTIALGAGGGILGGGAKRTMGRDMNTGRETTTPASAHTETNIKRIDKSFISPLPTASQPQPFS